MIMHTRDTRATFHAPFGEGSGMNRSVIRLSLVVVE